MICLSPPLPCGRIAIRRAPAASASWARGTLAGLALVLAACPAVAQSWSPLGPALVLDDSTWGGRAPSTGRVNVVVPNPHNPLEDIWVGSAGGGVWNGSVWPTIAWTPMTDDQPSLAVGAIALDSCTSARCKTVWVGTGENGLRRDTQFGRGILKGTWNSVTAAYDWAQLGDVHFTYGNVTRLLLDPKSPDNSKKHLYVALSSGETSNASHSTVTTLPHGAMGIWGSTDAGQSWDLLLDTGEPATDLEMDPYTPDRLFAAFRHQGVFRSEDAGRTWTPIVTGIPENLYLNADWPELAVTRPSVDFPATLYLVLGTCPAPHAHGSQPGYCAPAVYRSQDAGTTWSLRYSAASLPAMGEPLTSHVSSTHALTIHPSHPGELWYGGINLYHSLDGGQSWTTVGATTLHPHHHALSIVPTSEMPDGFLFYDASDGGLFLGDGDTIWNGTFQHGLQIAPFQSLAVRDRVLLGGVQGSGIDLSLGAEVWQHVDDGTAGPVLIESYAGSALFSSHAGVTPRRCTQPGGCFFDWQPIAGDPNNSNSIPVSPNTSWYAPFVQAKTGTGGHNALYFAAESLYRNVTEGGDPVNSPGWRRITPVGLGGGQPIPELGGIPNPITAVAVAAQNPNRAYIGFYDGQVFTTGTALGASPVWLPVASGLPARPVTSIAVAGEGGIVVVAFAGKGDHSLYVSVTGGNAWSPFDDSWDPLFANESVNVVRIGGTIAPQVWAGTDQGVFTRLGAILGPARFEKSAGLPNVAVYGLEIDSDGAVYAATHGRGVFRYSNQPHLSAEHEDCCTTDGVYSPKSFVAVSGNGFEPNKSCTMTLFSGSLTCGSSGIDASGANLKTDARGFLASSLPATYDDRQLAFACGYGFCLGGGSYASCPVTAVQVQCGARQATTAVREPVSVGSPSSTRLAFTPGRTGGTVTLTPVVMRNGGLSGAACQVRARYAAGESATSVLTKLANGLGTAMGCMRQGITAALIGTPVAGHLEGDEPTAVELVLRTSHETAVQLVTEVDVSGPAKVTVGGFGDTVQGRAVMPRVTFAGNPTGGMIRLTITSSLGVRSLEIETEPGDTIGDVVSAAYDGMTGRDTGGGLPIGGTGGPPRGTFTVLVDGNTIHLPHTISISIESSDVGVVGKLGTGH